MVTFGGLKVAYKGEILKKLLHNRFLQEGERRKQEVKRNLARGMDP